MPSGSSAAGALGILGGSGITGLPEFELVREHRFPTPYGPTSAPILEGRLFGERVLFLERHGQGHRIAPHEVNYRANISALKVLGATQLVSLSAVGSLREDIHPGDVVVVDQYIDLTRKRSNTFFEGGAVAHVSFAEPTCLALASACAEALRMSPSPTRVHGKGTYICIEGPQFSTRAESLFYRSIGASVIGMTALPEAKLAREVELPYVTIAFATDFDAWHETEAAVSVDAVLAVLEKNRARIPEFLKELLPQLPDPTKSPAYTALASALIGTARAQLTETLSWLRPHTARPITVRPSAAPGAGASVAPSVRPSVLPGPTNGTGRASVAPNSVAPNSVAPNSVAPNSVAPNSVAPNSAGVAPSRISSPPTNGAPSDPSALRSAAVPEFMAPAPPRSPVESERETWTGSAPAPNPKIASTPASVGPSVAPVAAPSAIHATATATATASKPTPEVSLASNPLNPLGGASVSDSPALHSSSAKTESRTMNSQNPVLIIGSMALDDLHLPSGTFTDVVGGAATFAAVSSALFSPARVVAVVGADFPEAVIGELQRRNVETQGIVRLPGKTFKWAGRYAENLSSRETLDTQLNVFADFRPVLPEAYRKSRYVLLGNIHPSLQLEVLDQLEPGAFVAADTMNFWITGERALLGKLLARIDCLIINDEELRELSGIHNLRKAAAAVLAMGPKQLLVKKGEHGALLFDGTRISFVPAYPLELETDPTGAGDAFAGALLGRLAEIGRSDATALREAMSWAATVASFCVEGVGLNRLSEIKRADVEGRLHELAEMTNLAR